MRKVISGFTAAFLLGTLLLVAQEPQGDGKALVPLDAAKDGKGAQPAKGRAKSVGNGGGGFGGAKNVRVLKGELPPAMQSFVQALGLLDKGTCSYCHVVPAYDSDEKPQKVKARNMIRMVQDINALFGDGKQHVNCYTCHRGSPSPLLTEPYDGAF